MITQTNHLWKIEDLSHKSFAIFGVNFKSFFYNVAQMFFIGSNLKDDGSPTQA